MKDTDTHLLIETVHLCTFLLALQCRQTAIKVDYLIVHIYLLPTQYIGFCSWPWFVDAALSEEE